MIMTLSSFIHFRLVLLIRLIVRTRISCLILILIQDRIRIRWDFFWWDETGPNSHFVGWDRIGFFFVRWDRRGGRSSLMGWDRTFMGQDVPSWFFGQPNLISVRISLILMNMWEFQSLLNYKIWSEPASTSLDFRLYIRGFAGLEFSWVG